MAALNRLSTQSLKINIKGRYSDGGGLYLNVTDAGGKSWVFVWKGKQWVTAKNKSGRREMGLGSYGEKDRQGVTLKKARELAADCRAMVRDGIDPKRNRDASKAGQNLKSFGEVAHEFIDLKEKSWRNPKHRAQWRMTVDTYCKAIKDKAIADISQDDVMQVINPLWESKNTTAKRVLARISNILGYATAKKMREGSNPAEWKGRIEYLVTDIPNQPVKHHAAIDYLEMPQFFAKMQTLDALAAKAIILVILTATRTNETLRAKWSEFDLERGLWVIPAERMKLQKPHAVPLNNAAIDMLSELYALRTSEYVFQGKKPNTPLSNMSMLMLLRRHKIENITIHGMRSTFRSWVHDKTNFEGIIGEQALAHGNPDKVEAAYLRSTAFDKRTRLMEMWCDYCQGKQSAEVVQLHGT